MPASLARQKGCGHGSGPGESSGGEPAARRSLNILLFLRSFPPAIGGIERFAESLAERLVDKGHNVRVVTRTHTEGFEPDRPYQVVRSPSPEISSSSHVGPTLCMRMASPCAVWGSG